MDRASGAARILPCSADTVMPEPYLPPVDCRLAIGPLANFPAPWPENPATCGLTAYAAGRVEATIPGDWADAQIALGLLTRRHTPRPDYATQRLGEGGAALAYLTARARRANRRRKR